MQIYDFLHQAAILTALRLEQLLGRNHSRPHNRLSRFVRQFEELSLSAFQEYLENEAESFSMSRQRYQQLLERVPESCRSIAASLLDLAILHAVYPEIREALREAGISVSIDAACFLETEQTCPAATADVLYEALHPLFLPEQREEAWVAQVRFQADRRLLDYLSAADSCPLQPEGSCELFTENSSLPEMLLYEEACERLTAAFSVRSAVLQLRGDAKSGRKFLLRHIARRCGRRVLFVDFSALSGNEAPGCIALILREAIFAEAAVCWYNVTEEGGMPMQAFSVECIRRFQRYDVQVCCCTEHKLDLSSYAAPVCLYDMPALTQHDRIWLWNCFGKEYAIEPTQFAIRYKLSCSQIAEVFRRRQYDFPLWEETEKQIFERICAQIANPSDRLFHIVHPEYRLSDLVLPTREKEKILEICANFQYYHKVYTEWNMQSRMPYGNAISVILCGPPGTGKTMTAHVIANQLELPLFHADLSQIADKYIGETEKHLEAIFTEAEKSNCVLLLDEADAICGKRSEVSDSKDRYANNATAFLLQRLERYDGIVVLATNFVNNLDTAFMRRMKYILQFSIPTADVRKEIWQSCFPAEMPVAADLDFDYLAEQFDFAGANIKNVVLSAAFLAASEQQPVQMRHILLSIENEYMKFQKNILAGEFGKYSQMYLEIRSQS